MSTLVMVTALEAWLASGGGAAVNAGPKDMSSAPGIKPGSGDMSVEDRTARLLAGFPDAVDERASKARPHYAPRIYRAFAFASQLGEVDARLNIQGKQITLAVVAPDAGTRTRLRSEVAALRSQFEQAGLDLASLGITAPPASIQPAQ